MVVAVYCVVFLFKLNTAYEMLISDWSSDVCSSDLGSLNSAVRDFSVRVQNKAGPSGQPGAMDAAPCGATIRIARVGASSNPDSPPYRLSAPGNGQIEILPDRKSTRLKSSH